MTLDFAFRRFSCPLSVPLETASGSIESRDGFLIRISDGETWGVGEATPLPGFTESLDTCESALQEAADEIGSDGANVSDATPARDTPPVDGSTGVDVGCVPAIPDAVDRTAAARHGVTLALTDLLAVHESVPLYRHLGAPERVARVPVNATVGDGSPEETASAVQAAVDAGFTCCKVKVGRRPVDADVERIRCVREAIGPGVELRVDANGAWTVDEARRAIDTFVDLEVTMLEQPLPAGALEGHTELRGYGVDIALDEGLLEHGVDAIVSTAAADAIVLKPMALGGIDVASQVAVWAAESGLTPIVTTTIDAVVARTAAVHLAALIPDVPACGLATGSMLASDLGHDPVFIEKGTAVVPQAKGLGVSTVWDE